MSSPTSVSRRQFLGAYVRVNQKHEFAGRSETALPVEPLTRRKFMLRAQTIEQEQRSRTLPFNNEIG